MAEVIDFSKHREYSKAQKDDIRKLKNYVDSIYKDYYDLSDNDKILKKEFDNIYLKIMIIKKKIKKMRIIFRKRSAECLQVRLSAIHGRSSS